MPSTTSSTSVSPSRQSLSLGREVLRDRWHPPIGPCTSTSSVNTLGVAHPGDHHLERSPHHRLDIATAMTATIAHLHHLGRSGRDGASRPYGTVVHGVIARGG